MLATRALMGAANQASLDEDLMDWLVNVDVSMTPISHVNWNTNLTQGSDVYNLWRQSSSTLDDEVNFDVVLAAGTWTFELIHTKSSNSGIVSVQLDGVEKGTIDFYNGTTTANNRTQITSIIVGTSAKVRLKLKVTSKNASSSGYAAIINHAQFKRTA
jgi:hypothetical protein